MSAIPDFVKGFFGNLKALAYFIIGLVVMFTSAYALTNTESCATTDDLRTKLKSYNYAFIVIAFLFLIISVSIYLEVHFVIDHIEIITTVLGSALFITGLFFLTTAEDCSCPSSFTACAHIQWVIGLLFALYGALGIYGLVKGAKGEGTKYPSDNKKKEKEEEKEEIIPRKSDTQILAEKQSRLEKIEKQYDTAIEKDDMELADRLEDKITTLKTEIESINLNKEARKSQLKSNLENIQQQRKNLNKGNVDVAKPAQAPNIFQQRQN